MREIKFRAWSEEHKAYFYPRTDLIGRFLYLRSEKPYNKAGGIHPEGNLDYFLSNKAPVEQFTGLKDKNGKEIYEGDIVKSEYLLPCEIKFKNGSFAFDDGYFYDHFVIYNDCEVEIIGNIHENAELLS